ncbi:MAG: ATP synthase F1 subunit gamma [Clostridia bacterium]|nr:ATP synthase F1 subunit gamma [Clostridia bacterium]
MAGASLNDIKTRIKSVKGTMQITKAMELVATSKLRRAKERAEACRPFYEETRLALSRLLPLIPDGESCWNTPTGMGRTLIIVIAGERGLAGGYNSNVHKTVAALAERYGDVSVLPIGKKAVEFSKRRGFDLFMESAEVDGLGVSGAKRIGEAVCEGFHEGKFNKIVMVYTHFKSMLTQLPVYEELLPLRDIPRTEFKPIFDTPPEEMLENVVKDYVGGVIYCAISESLASECAARRTAMNSANKNAEEMIDTLMLKYNRARQAVITNEITEIVSGAEAL